MIFLQNVGIHLDFTNDKMCLILLKKTQFHKIMEHLG